MNEQIYPLPVKMIHEIMEIEGLPLKFSDKLVLRKASEEEVYKFRNTLIENPNLFPVSTIHGERIPMYEVDHEKWNDGDKDIGWNPVNLTSDKFRYWVFEDNVEKNEDIGFGVLKIALKLLPVEFTISMECDLFGNTHYDPRELFQSTSNDQQLVTKCIPKVNINNFEGLLQLVNGLIKIKNKHQSLKLPFEIYFSSFILPNNSKHQLLVLFSSLESLLTHKPTDSGDSITKQLRRKINLLNNRFQNPIENIKLPDGIKLDGFIKKLYDLRSTVTHGGDYKYNSILKNEYEACSYLKYILKQCLIQAIKEPQLIIDLARC